MSGKIKTLAAQVDSDGDLYKKFIEHKEEMSAQSNSEVVRDLLNSGLAEKESELTADSSAKHLVNRIETFLAVLAFWFGSSSVAEALAPVVGDLLTSLLIAVVGVLVFVAFAWVHLPTAEIGLSSSDSSTVSSSDS